MDFSFRANNSNKMENNNRNYVQSSLKNFNKSPKIGNFQSPIKNPGNNFEQNSNKIKNNFPSTTGKNQENKRPKEPSVFDVPAKSCIAEEKLPVKSVQENNFNNKPRQKTPSLSLMQLSKPGKVLKLNSSLNQKFQKNKQEVQSASGKENLKRKTLNIGESPAEQICLLTGTVERVIKYGKIFENHFCYFQVIGSVISITDGQVRFEKNMLLRDTKSPILKLVYYSNSTHINIEDFHLGQNLRAVGRMNGSNRMSAITIRAATKEEIENLPRMCYISDYAVSALCGDSQFLN